MLYKYSFIQNTTTESSYHAVSFAHPKNTPSSLHKPF